MRTAQESVHLVAATIGFVSFAALWAGTVWGTVLRSGWATSRLRHQTVHGIHMQLVLLGLTLGVVHGLVQLIAPGGKVRAVDAVVPFTDRADPVGVGLGVLALDLLLASALSVLIQRKLGFQRWRALHSLGYLAFTMIAAHLLISGSEVAAAPIRTAIALAWAVVVVAGLATVAPVARMPRALLDRLSRRHRTEEITVAVDPGTCGSFGFCEQEAPAIFTLRSDQRLAYRSVVSSEQAEAAMRAALVCPARAIKLGRLPATVVVSQPTAETSTVSPLAASLSPHTSPSPHTGPLAAAHTGPLAAAHTGPQAAAHTGPLAAAHTGPQAAAHTGPLAAAHTGPQAAAGSHTGAQAAVPDPHTGFSGLRRTSTAESTPGPHTGRQPGPQPLTATASPHPGPQPGVHPVSGPAPHTGPLPAVGTRSAGTSPHTGPLPAVGAPAASGSHPRPVPVAGPVMPPVPPVPPERPERPAAGSRRSAASSRSQRGPVFQPAAVVVPRRTADPAAPDPLPPPSDLQDTGRHHLPPLRGIAGGRS